MAIKLAFSFIAVLFFYSINVTFRHELNKNWVRSMKESVPILLTMLAMIIVMMITNEIQTAKIILNMTGPAL